MKSEISPFLLDRGLNLDEKKLDDLAEAKDIEDLIDKLKPTLVYKKIGKDLEQFKEEASLKNIINALDRYFLEVTKRFAYTSPVSILPILDYFVRKEIEVKNIRAIVRGKSLGLDEKIIRDMLVF